MTIGVLCLFAALLLIISTVVGFITVGVCTNSQLLSTSLDLRVVPGLL
jgi:hypothetical protein